MMKELKPGRVIIVTESHHYNKLAIFLSIAGSRELKFKVLVLDDVSDTTSRSVRRLRLSSIENVPQFFT